MLTSDSRELRLLWVDTPDPFTLIWIRDEELRTIVGPEFGVLAASLPVGRYEVYAQSGDGMFHRTVDLEKIPADECFLIDTDVIPFDSPAPLAGLLGDDPDLARWLDQASRRLDFSSDPDAGGGFFLFQRGRITYGAEPSETAPAGNFHLDPIDKSQGGPSLTMIDKAPLGSGWTWGARLRPGSYLLRWSLAGDATRQGVERVIYIWPDCQTQVFLDSLPPDESGMVSPAFDSTSLFVTPVGSGFNPHDPSRRWCEQVRHLLGSWCGSASGDRNEAESASLHRSLYQAVPSPGLTRLAEMNEVFGRRNVKDWETFRKVYCEPAPREERFEARKCLVRLASLDGDFWKEVRHYRLKTISLECRRRIVGAEKRFPGLRSLKLPPYAEKAPSAALSVLTSLARSRWARALFGGEGDKGGEPAYRPGVSPHLSVLLFTGEALLQAILNAERAGQSVWGWVYEILITQAISLSPRTESPTFSPDVSALWAKALSCGDHTSLDQPTTPFLSEPFAPPMFSCAWRALVVVSAAGWQEARSYFSDRSLCGQIAGHVDSSHTWLMWPSDTRAEREGLQPPARPDKALQLNQAWEWLGGLTEDQSRQLNEEVQRLTAPARLLWHHLLWRRPTSKPVTDLVEALLIPPPTLERAWSELQATVGKKKTIAERIDQPSRPLSSERDKLAARPSESGFAAAAKKDRVPTSGSSPIAHPPALRKPAVARSITDDLIRIRMKGFDYEALDRTAQDIVATARRTGADVHGPIPLPTRIERYTVLRSPHIDRKSREQFEIRTHNRLIDILHPTGMTIEELNKGLSLPPGVDIKIRVMSAAGSRRATAPSRSPPAPAATTGGKNPRPRAAPASR